MFTPHATLGCLLQNTEDEVLFVVPLRQGKAFCFLYPTLAVQTNTSTACVHSHKKRIGTFREEVLLGSRGEKGNIPRDVGRQVMVKMYWERFNDILKRSELE